MLGEITNSKYKKIALILGIMLIVLYVAENSFLFNRIGNTIFTYGIKPGYFIILALLIGYKLPKIHLMSKANYKSTVYAWAFNCGVIYISINILGGILQGFGKSPYSHTLIGILTNSFAVGTALIGRESIRVYLVSSFMRRKSKLALVSIVLLMTLTNIRLLRFTGITDIKTFTIFFSETIIPELCNNILATYFVVYGGKWASVIYLGIIEAAMWLSPILPAMNWLGKGVIGMMIPIFCLLYIMNAYMKMSKEVKTYKEKQELLWQWVPEAVGSILLIWFTAGVFSIYPSVIATGSMKPMIEPGDVILIEKVKDMKDIEALGVDDVIQFKRDNILITHRIIEVLREEGVPSYRTKGDNNSAIDGRIVRAEEVKGVLTQVIPKIGWPTLIFKSGNPNVIDDVEF
ncbi:signal peptidase I [Cellulosilyticum sp. I15G10I2]|uniref:signal peptidase I n=1 Tax=Cellulosilyticum sp. I15G10I2 TaxID=1892843 RepID=UPI00085C30BC|nr:signal peptidase I [Cellulosilyticum sp. I15G10I2]